MEVTFFRIFMKPMNDNINRNFSGWWAILFIIISFFIIPIPFDIAFSYLGDWAYQNPVSVEIVFGEVTLYPIKDNLLQIFSMTSAVLFIIWIMKVLNIPLSALGSLEIQRKDLFFWINFFSQFYRARRVLYVASWDTNARGLYHFYVIRPNYFRIDFSSNHCSIS